MRERERERRAVSLWSRLPCFNGPTHPLALPAHLTDSVLKLAPRHVDANYNVANSMLRGRQAREAIPLYLAALEEAPGRVDVRTNVATAYAFLGGADNVHAAITHFRAALAAKPDHATALSGLQRAIDRTSHHVSRHAEIAVNR